MDKETFGSKVARMRKEKGMTQLELAEKMGVTDKAVSKWERDLSYPDIGSFPKLAEIFHVTTDELLQVEAVKEEQPAKKSVVPLIELVLKGIALAMGVAVLALSTLGQLEPGDGVSLLGIGLACLALVQFSQKAE